ncbi:TB2/DP1, HVA22 family [Rhizoctonia solani]|uniref:Protein YOP1 n=1 Tax=Rhizoctonia solani TaxID=456999 RepID=A0A8H7IEH9_9AGAM|nr:TB2/DP1, HVA22 family [Rhizoctonia solani]
MSSPNYPEQPYDPNATAQAPISPPGNNTTTNDAKLHAQEKAQQAQQQAQEKAQMARRRLMANHPAVQQAQASAAEYHARADKALSQYPAMNKLEQRTGRQCTRCPASNLVGWGLPAYMSMRAIETPSGRDDVQWLTYWVIFGFLTYLESFALRILPQFKGAATMYHAAIRPSMDRARLQATSPTTRYPATTSTQNAPPATTSALSASTKLWTLFVSIHDCINI